jgi:hypothetical protein
MLLTRISNKDELSGLLNLLIANASRVLPEKTIYRRGTGKDIADEYDLQANSLAAFYDKFIEEADLSSWASSSVVYDCYKNFCKKINASPIRDREFFAYAKKHFRAVKAREKTPGGNIRILRGIELDEEKYNAFINSTIYGPSKDHLNEEEDQQVQVNHQKRILDLLKKNICCIENNPNIDGPAGSNGPDIVLDGFSLDQLDGSQIDSILKRCLAILQRLKNPITPFVLSIHADGLGAKVPPKRCSIWLKANGWSEATPSWVNNGNEGV